MCRKCFRIRSERKDCAQRDSVDPFDMAVLASSAVDQLITLTTTLWGRGCYYFHFTREETEAHRPCLPITMTAGFRPTCTGSETREETTDPPAPASFQLQGRSVHICARAHSRAPGNLVPTDQHASTTGLCSPKTQGARWDPHQNTP